MVSKQIPSYVFDDIVASVSERKQSLAVVKLALFFANTRTKAKRIIPRKGEKDLNRTILKQHFIFCVDYQDAVDFKAVESSINNLPENEDLYVEVEKKYHSPALLQIMNNDKRNFIIILK